MPRTTPPRPLDIEALFPELAAHRGTTTRLHPRPGSPTAADSSVGGPFHWPADEPWPVCTAPHRRDRGRRPSDVHRYRQVLAAAWARDRPTDEERQLLEELGHEHRVPGLADNAPVPMVALAQLYRRDVPDLLPGPDGRDLLQVFWCPFDRHGDSGYGLALDLRWRHSPEVAEVPAAPPLPQLVGSPGFLPEPCVLHPEQVAAYQYADLLPDDLCARLDAWDEAQEEESESAPCYQFDLSIPPGWRAGGFAAWNLTDPTPMDCPACATPMALLLTVATTEWDGGSASWKPLEDQRLPAPPSATPTEVTVGRWGKLNIFACPAAPAHPHRWSIQ